MINKTPHTKSANRTSHWSVRAIAAETGLSRTSVHRYFRLFGLQPHLQESFKLHTDAFLTEKLRDVVGLYLGPPEKVLMICVDEMSQCQALQRMLQLGFGYVERVTHDYKRHGTMALFAALDVLSGAILAQCKRGGHRYQEFLSLLREIDRAAPPELDIHRIVNNYGMHKHAKIKAWLAAHPRWHGRFISTYCSGLNQAERFFGLIMDKAIRRGALGSIKTLITKIDHFVSHYNQNCKPFIYTAIADSILAKLATLCA